MGFILDGLETESYDRTYRDRDLLKRIVGYFWPHRRAVAWVVGGLLVQSATASGASILLAEAVDGVAADPSTRTMLLLTGAILLLGVVGWASNYVQQHFTARAVGNVVLKLREDVFNATIRHDMSFYDEHPSGKIVSRVTSDTQDFSEVVSLVTNLLGQLVMVGLLTVWLFLISWWLTLILIGMTPLVIWLALRFRRVARRVTLNARRVTATIRHLRRQQSPGLPSGPAARTDLEHHLPHHRTGRRHRHGCLDLRRRAVQSGRCCDARTVVSVHAGGGLLLVAAVEHRLVLESVPRRAGRGRTGVRPD